MKKYCKTIVWILFVTILLLLPGSTLPKKSVFNIEHLDKVVHCGLFLILQLLFLYDYGWGKIELPKFRLWYTLLLFTIYAVVTELLQHWFTNRTGSYSDALMDILGLFTGLLVYRYAYRFTNQSYPLNF